MKAKLKCYANYMQMEASYEVFMMIRTLDSITFKFEGHKHKAHVLPDAKAILYLWLTKGRQHP